VGKLVVGAVFGLLLAHTAAAQSYPNRPVRLVVPYPAGGGPDLLARTIGERRDETRLRRGRRIGSEESNGTARTVSESRCAEA
jgi:tripartite-type tricarboxylate transporter receptor subunit TctC